MARAFGKHIVAFYHPHPIAMLHVRAELSYGNLDEKHMYDEENLGLFDLRAES